MTPPKLTFACELPADALTALFADRTVTDTLVALGAKVSLGILDLSLERAAVVRSLNAAGVPVVAWLLLPTSQGYWFNADNGPYAVRRYAEFRAWTAEHNLDWDAIGIDIEPDLREMQALAKGELGRVLPTLLRRSFDRARVARAQAIYTTLVTQMHIDGYRVESYQVPLIVDERRADSHVLQQLFGVVDVLVDRETLMLYTSFMRSGGPGLFWSYAGDADGIGVGSTGGGVDIEGPPPLRWSEFVRDLRLARRWQDEIFIFSLEGCVERGYLRRLKGFAWDGPVHIPERGAQQVDFLRHFLRGVLWTGSRPALVLAGLAFLLGFARLRSRRDRRRRGEAA
ncbi:MAG: hypothetical protein JXC32_14180 [Anaerolineae bacterium]|nr:hypothetical protein [Anaerolineae bacterium]